MNNRYIFRGKRKDNGEWVYNEHPCGHCIVPYEVIPSTVENLEIKQYLDEIKMLKERVYKLESKLRKAENCIWDIEYASEKSATSDRIIEALEEYNKESNIK